MSALAHCIVISVSMATNHLCVYLAVCIYLIGRCTLPLALGSG